MRQGSRLGSALPRQAFREIDPPRVAKGGLKDVDVQVRCICRLSYLMAYLTRLVGNSPRVQSTPRVACSLR